MLPDFVESTCLPYLLSAQNGDGGWGYKSGSTSRAEPTAWALLALLELPSTPVNEKAASRAARFLTTIQLAAGGWPASPGATEGCWATSLACWALLGRPDASANVKLGLQWLSSEVPGEAKAFRRFVRSLMPKSGVVAQNDAYYGWSWTSGTASWVEPTSYALILIQQAPAELRPSQIDRRKKLGEDMLFDRMCPGGGWNCGNPMVYGVPGEPQVGPTVWALLALRGHPERPEVQKSLDWLAKFQDSVRSPASFALAQIALGVYGKTSPHSADALRLLYADEQLLRGVPEMAWATLALGNTSNWLARTERGGH